MELAIVVVLALLLDVVADGFFTFLLSHRSDEVAIRPELAAPQLLLDRRAARKHFARDQALENGHNLGGAVSGHCLNQEMNMVAINADFQKRDLEAQSDVKTNLSKHRFDGFVKHNPTISGNAYQMIDQHTYIMTLVNEAAHALTSTQGGSLRSQVTPQAAGH